MDEEKTEEDIVLNSATKRDDNIYLADDPSSSGPENVIEGLEQILAGETASKESLEEGLDF